MGKMDDLVYWKSFIENDDRYSTAYTNKMIRRYISFATEDDNTELFNLIFNYLQIPTNLTLKEKIVYYQLLGDDHVH